MAFDASLYTRILERALKRGEAKAKAFCRSKTLRRFMYQRIDLEGKQKSSGVIRVPHYWAKFFHDGRDAVVAKAKLLVWFKNPNKDPRLKGGYPVYRSDNKTLDQLITKDEFRRLRNSGEIIVTKKSGPTKQPQNPFFSNTGGMAGLSEDVSRIGQEETYRYVEEQLRSRGLKNKTITRNI